MTSDAKAQDETWVQARLRMWVWLQAPDEAKIAYGDPVERGTVERPLVRRAGQAPCISLREKRGRHTWSFELSDRVQTIVVGFNFPIS